ncbi:MAG: phosphate ABC transporter ATP-binding protein [Anaerolineae bacterium]
MPSEIRVRGLTVYYDRTPVVKNVSVDFVAGKVTAIIGPSGCGKTSLLRSLNRLAEEVGNCQVQGQIFLDGEEIHQMDPMLLRRRVGMVFQRPNPFHMSIRENILYGIKATNLPVDHKMALKTSLKRAGIWDEIKRRLDDNAWGLSVGQQQRVCIARTLAVNPQVILMDEPAASLDPASAARVEASIASMKGEFTVVIVTHNMQQAMRVSDYTAFMYLGELVEYGETAQVFHEPRQQATRDYVNGRFG